MFAVETEPSFAVNRRPTYAAVPAADPVFTAYTASMSSLTFTAWLSPVSEDVTYSGTVPLYGIICANNPVNFVDPYGLWAGWASGEPVSTGESFVPIWGSGRQAVNDFSSGHYMWGSVNTVMAVSDIFLIKTVATIGVKGAWKAGSATWGATRKWLGKEGYAEAGQHVHHGVIPRGGWGKNVPDVIKNNPFNLKPLDPPPGVSMDAWHKMVEGKLPGLNPAERWWAGTPDWLRYAEISGAGRIGNAMRGDDADDCK